MFLFKAKTSKDETLTALSSSRGGQTVAKNSINRAINDVAKAKQILYVIDASAGRGLLVSDGEDLYDAVKEKLGLLADVKQPTAPVQN